MSVLDRIKSVFGLLKGWYEKFFEKFEAQGEAGVIATEWLKEQLKNGNAEAVANYIPGEWDDALVAKAKANLVPALEVYAKTYRLAMKGNSRLEIVQTVFDYINSLGTKRSFLSEICSDLIVFLADGKIDWNEGLILGQKMFWQLFNRKRKLAPVS